MNVPEKKKKANLKKFLGNLKVHFKTKSAPMHIHRTAEMSILESPLTSQPKEGIKGLS